MHAMEFAEIMLETYGFGEKSNMGTSSYKLMAYFIVSTYLRQAHAGSSSFV